MTAADPSPIADMIGKVLVVCSGQEADTDLLVAARGFAGPNGASLTVFSVVELPSDAAEWARAAQIDVEIAQARLVEDRRAALLARIEQTGPDDDISVEVRIGKPFIEIIRLVIAEGFDFVVKTAEPLQGVQRFLFSSTDQHLLRKCPCPVWLRKPGAPHAIGKVLAAVDVDLDDASEPETLELLNIRVMQTAARMSPISEAMVGVLHAWDAPGEGLVRLWASGPDSRVAAETYVASIHASRARAVEGLAAQVADRFDAAGLGRPTYHTILERGPVRSVIAEQTRALAADILVIGTVARTSLHGVIIGNTAEDVLNSIDCSVVAVKPPGFVTPLEF